jgi:hypothetical protein
LFAWATPRVQGKAIALKDPCALSGISGKDYPTEEADTPQNRPISALCVQREGSQRSAGPVTQSGPAGAGGCTLEQVLSMKNAGLSDDQIKAACTK